MFCFHKRTPRPPVAAQLRVVFSPHSTVVFNIPLSAGVVLHLCFSCTNVRRTRRSRLNFVLSFPPTQRLRSTSTGCRCGFAPAFFLYEKAILQQAATGGRGLLGLRLTPGPRPPVAAYWCLLLPSTSRCLPVWFCACVFLARTYAAPGGRGLLASYPPGRDRRMRLTSAKARFLLLVLV